MDGEAGRVGPAVMQRTVDRFQHAIQIFINIVIPKSKCSKILARQSSVTFRVAHPMPVKVMLAAINFDD